MAGTYSYSGDPSLSTLDQVRFLARDTSDPFNLFDEEINWLLTQDLGPYLAAADAADLISGKFATLANKSIGDLQLSFQGRAQEYAKLSAKLRAQSLRHGGTPTPYAGGITIDDKNTNR